MSYFDAIPPTIVTLGSFLLLVQKYYNRNDVSIQLINTYTTNNNKNQHVRFSTAKRDTIKLGICIIQTSLFSFLLGWKIDKKISKIINGYSLSDDIIHTGLLVFCWFYSTVIAVIDKQPRIKEWRKTFNIHLTSIFSTAFLCSMWHLRSAFITSIDDDVTTNRLEKIAAICNFILSSIVTAVAITTPRGPPLFDNGRPVTPLTYSSILDVITFAAITPLMKKAYYKVALNDSDIDQLPFNLRALTAYHKFKVWRSESLLYRIWKANNHIMIYQLVATISSALIFYVPTLFLYNFLEFIQENPLNKPSDWGYVCIFGMLISNILSLLSLGQQWYWSASVFNVSVRGMLNAELYAKSLKMLNGLYLKDENKDNESNSSKNNNLAASVGKITNLMAVDTNRIGQFSMWWTTFIDCPIQITIALYFLYQLLGIASIYAFITMIVILPLNQLVSKSFAKSQNELMKVRDHRVNLMNEILQGIRMIKLFAWEKKWKTRILDVRENELKEIFKAFIYVTWYNLIWLATPVLVTIVMFYVFTKVQGNELTPSIAFTSITILNELRMVLTNLPEVFMQAYQASISIRRIETFLDSGEIEIESAKTDTSKIGFKNASVTWNKYEEVDELGSSEFIMKDLNIEFPIGKLSIICGPTGSGKTLLLMSLLRETNLIKGEIFFPRSPEYILNPDPLMSNWILDNCVALVAQESFLQNDSIRNNITFGLPFQEERYKAVIKACALQRDFEILEDGDLTEIGEKGLTLSGGQKQRCSLASFIGNLSSCLHNVIMMIGTIMVISAVTKEFIIASLIFSVAYVFLGLLFAKCSRDMKRLDSVTKSPIYSHFGETIIGISTIRAYGATKKFMEEMLLRIDINNRPFFMKCTLNRWLSVRYNIMGAILTFIAGIFILWNLDRIDAGLAGLSLSFAMAFSKQIMWSVRNYAEFEMSLNSIERVCEFLEISQEAAAIIEPRPPASWPHNGNIKVENLLIKYSQELEPVLHHISFEIFGQEKVGIVGRTGSGKSTISLSLFRFIEPSDGKIIIDGIDISTIGVEDLRSKLTIIPQDPILFTGTIRSNLDVFSQYEEYELYESLRRVHLLPSIEDEQHLTTTLDDNINVFKDLDTPINEGGKNLSQGQRQLLCLARALLKKSKIILMDEATASIDFAMDDKIQKMIRREFVDCTILCIAHRLRTVIDYDRILVLDQGNVIEFDSPYNLISNSNSSFYQMCQNSGEFDILKASIIKQNNNTHEFF
ncbi:P-loop containing nucleoside triphosphate hydrolase protein [Glomus cerebriforme]|uniref:P-loop containing nucleoside triphosphate hydrolase protein n=1 Tax=Glomus cerebriforme TaxID=658196 RepID=A0A397S8U7_9GLOM|nr:P-loop containing nucleoside triphosphate hydrolase protein [Glomus cerebriforme]